MIALRMQANWVGDMEVTSGRNSAERPEAPGGAGREPAFSNQVRTINLALQGGGAHGAFTWGVLDRLLEQKDLIIEGISGTSAGGANGAHLGKRLYEKRR